MLVTHFKNNKSTKLEQEHKINNHKTSGMTEEDMFEWTWRVNQNKQPGRAEWTRLVYGSRLGQFSRAPLLYN